MNSEKTEKRPRTTGELTKALLNTAEDQLPAFYARNAEELLPEDKPFAAALRRQLEACPGISQQKLFLAAGISQKTGYKYTSGERIPEDRDTVLRLCLALGCDIRQTDRLLKAAGKEPLYVRSRRDGILLRALQEGCRDMETIDRRLLRAGLPPLWAGKEDAETASAGTRK